MAWVVPPPAWVGSQACRQPALQVADGWRRHASGLCRAGRERWTLECDMHQTPNQQNAAGLPSSSLQATKSPGGSGCRIGLVRWSKCFCTDKDNN